MTENAPQKNLRLFIAGALALALAVGFASVPAGRDLAGKWFRSLRVQQVQAVNVDLTAFTDPSANPSLQQMVSKMISDKVVVTARAQDQPAPDAAAAAQLAGFDVRLLRLRKDAPKLLVASRSATTVTVDRARLQEIVKESGHPEISLPQSIDGASINVEIPPSVRLQYGTCPGPASTTDAIAHDLTGPSASSTQYSDCVRFYEGRSPTVDLPPGLDLQPLAEIGLELAGMTPKQAHDFLQTVNWQTTLVMAVPRFVRSYEVVRINGAEGTLLTMAGRRGPGYTLIWAKDGMAYSLTGFGDSSQALELAESLK